MQVKDNPLRKLGALKDALIDYFMEDEDITALVMPHIDPNYTFEQNWKGGTFLTPNQEKVTVDGHCFDIPYIPETITDDQTIICMETYISEIETQRIQEIILTLYVYSHKNSIHLSEEEKIKFMAKGYAGNRVDMAIAAIDNALLKVTREFGIGKLELLPRNPIQSYEPHNRFYGKKAIYSCSDFHERSKSKR